MAPANGVIRARLAKAYGYRGDQLNLPVADLDAALPFYESVLGFRVAERPKLQPRSATLTRDAVSIGLAENGGDPTQDGCAFHVTGLDALHRELHSKISGLGSIGVEQHDGVAWRVFYVVAPDGLCYWFGERNGTSSGEPNP